MAAYEYTALDTTGREHRGVRRRALGAAIPGQVVRLAVAVVLEVRLVVLLVVGDEVVEGETVMGGDEVDRRGGATVGAATSVYGPSAR